MQVVWVSMDGNRPYRPEEDARSVQRFLLYENGSDGQLLLLAADRNFGSHPHMWQQAGRNGLLLSGPPTGAGDCQSGKLFCWRSTSFGVRTPEKYHAEILEALGIELSDRMWD